MLLLSGNFWIGIGIGLLLGYLFHPLIKAGIDRLIDYIQSIW